MAKEFAKRFYKSKDWQRCRASYIQQRVMMDGGLCEVCHKVPGYIVHHKIPLTPSNINDTCISLSHDNLQYDCKYCHDREDEHALVKQSKTRCDFDIDGQPMPPP